MESSMMNRLPPLILGCCAFALSAAAMAETAKPAAPTEASPSTAKMAKGLKAPTTRRKSWSLKPSGNQTQQASTMVGPPVPAPQRQVIPQKRVRKKPVDLGGGIKKVDATPIARQMINKQRANTRN
jgi:hypothetical protein